MKIFVGQPFRLIINCNTDLTDASVLKVKYISPLGVAGTWDATLDDTDNTRMYVDFDLDNDNLLETAGQYQAWGKATFDSGIIPGELTVFSIYNEGT